MVGNRASYEITAEDKTRAGIDSAKKNFKELGDSALNLKGVFGAALGAISAGAIGSAFKNVLDGADSMGKLAQQTGIAVEQLSGLNYAAKMSDVETEALGSSLKKLAKNAFDTANGTGEAKDAFAALGISVKDSAGKVRGGGDLLNELADKFAGLEDGTEKTALAMQIFGKSGAQMIPLLNEGSKGIAEMTAEAEQFGLIITRDVSESAEALNDNLTRLGSAIEGAMIQAFKDTIPALRDLSDEVIEFVKRTELVKTAGEAANIGLKSLINGGLIVKSVFQQLGTLIGGVAAAFVQFFQGVATFDMGEITAAGETMKSVYADVVDNASRDIERMAKVWDAAGSAAKKASNDTAAAGNNTTTTLNRTGKAAKDAEKSIKEYEKSLVSLIDELDPTAKATRDYMEQVALLDRAWVDGRISGEEYDRLMLLLATDTKAVEEAAKDAAKAQEEAAKKREELAKEEAERMQRPFDEAAEGIQDAFTDAFANIYSGNVDSFSDLAKQIKSVFVRLAAEITTLMVFSPQASFSSALAGTGLLGSGTAAAGTASSNGIGFNPLSAFSSFLGPAGSLLGIGAGGGALIGQLTGGNTIGSSVGGAAGAYAGTLLGSGALGGITAGAVGALGSIGNFVFPGLGLVLGALGGGLFGGGGPSNQSAWGAINLSSGSTSSFGNMTGSKFSQQTVDARDNFFAAIQGFSQALQEITGGKLTGSVSADIGLRDGTQVSGLGAGVYGTPEKALQSIFDAMLDNLSGVSSQFKSVFNKLDLTDLESAVSDLSAAAYIINKDFVVAEPLNAAAQAIQNIKDNFTPLIDTAKRLGIATASLTSEQNKQIAALTTDFNADIDSMILSITDPLAYAMQEFEKVAQERLDNAAALGADLVDVERLNAIERANIVEQYSNQMGASLSQIGDFITSLTYSDLSPLSAQDQLDAAKSEFDSIKSLASAGDIDAIASAVNASQNYLRELQEFTGGGAEYAAAFKDVNEFLGGIISTSADPVVSQLQVNAEAQLQSTAQLIDEIAALRNEVAAQNAVSADLMERILVLQAS